MWEICVWEIDATVPVKTKVPLVSFQLAKAHGSMAERHQCRPRRQNSAAVGYTVH